MYDTVADDYCYPGTTVLKNKLHLTDADELDQRFRSSDHIGILPGPHPEEHRASDASRRMAAKAVQAAILRDAAKSALLRG